MSIHEPTGWSLSCDNYRCRNEYEPDDGQPDDEDELLSWAAEVGWITTVSPWSHYCCLDCLTAARASKSTRESQARDASYHLGGHQYHCCRLHGTHRQATEWDPRHSRGCREAGRLLAVAE